MGILMGKGGHHGIPLQRTVNQEVHARKKKDIGESSCGAAMPYDKEVPYSTSLTFLTIGKIE